MPQHPDPKRIVLILPCCIGDVVLATATLKALRRAYPAAHITWAVGSWSKPAIMNHDLLDDVLDTGKAALPLYTVPDFWRFVGQLRVGRFDLAVSLVRSPLMSLAVLLSGIPRRAGLNSNGRGFGYNYRADINPQHPRHEAEIYLDVARVLGIDTADCYANIPVTEAAVTSVRAKLAARGITGAYFVVNPAGGSNPGMQFDAKRYPPDQMAALTERLRQHLNATSVIVAGPGDTAVVETLQSHLPQPVPAFVGELSFDEIAALAAGSQLYIGNDTGLTHLAAAAGAKTAMILGPSDPRRYAPYTANAIAVWKTAAVGSQGVAAGAPIDWDWSRDGISVDEAFVRIVAFLET